MAQGRALTAIPDRIGVGDGLRPPRKSGLRGSAALMVGFGWWGRAKKGLSVDDEKQQKARRLLEKGSDKVAYDILKRLADGPLPDAACEVGLHRGCRRREESLSARQAVQDSAQGKGGDLCLTPPLLPHHWGQTLTHRTPPFLRFAYKRKGFRFPTGLAVN